jgi:hypothetical protein
MVAGMALDPRDIVNDIQHRSLGSDDDTTHADIAGNDVGDRSAPTLLPRPVPSRPPLPALREEPTVVAMHDAWARAHDADRDGGDRPRSLRTRIEAAVSTVTGPGQHQDRTVVASVIQAIDAVARRCDELAGRVAELEAVIGEVVDVLGADLARVRAELDRRSATGDFGGNEHATTGKREDRRQDG